MRIPLSVIIPVGPDSRHREWLTEAIQSVEQQAIPEDEIVLINDGGARLELSSHACQTQVFTLPCACGAVAAWNIGVAVAKHEQVVMLGADDLLLEGALSALSEIWLQEPDPLGYFFMGVRYSDGRADQGVPCQAAMVTKELWRYTGGFPQEATLGAIDNIFLQMLLTGYERGVSLARLHPVSPLPLYWYRVHPFTETNTRTQRWWGLIQILREDLAAKWMPNKPADQAR